MKILIIGGYGAFGGRLAELLADHKSLSIFIGGRTLRKAEQFCENLAKRRAQFTPIKLDKLNLTPVLTRYRPDIVIDASGPFNILSDNPYAVVKACLKANIHYLDLADGGDFVAGISDFDSVAKAANITILSGLSTCPALTGAVLREAQKTIDVKSIEAGIAPSPFAGMGQSVVQGIFDYAGGPIKLARNGELVSIPAFSESRSKTIAPPGAMPLKHGLFGLVDTPDLQLFPKTYTGIQTSWMGAGTRPEYMLRLLIAMSKIRVVLRLSSYSWLGGIGHKAMNALASGEHRGGLYMLLRGETKDVPQTHEWHIIAEGDDGPYIPCMAAAALIAKWLEGEIPKTGARAAHEALNLTDFYGLFSARDITYGWRTTTDKEGPIFKQVLGPAFDALPAQIKLLHAPLSTQVWRGEAETKGPSNIITRIAGLLAGIKVKTATTDVTVTITPSEKGELWERDFGGNKFKSRLTPGKGRNQYLMTESFGMISVAMALVFEDEKLHFIPRRWFVLGIPMPKALLPRGKTFEYEAGGKFWFNVNLNLPLFGRLASYKGWLKQHKN